MKCYKTLEYDSQQISEKLHSFIREETDILNTKLFWTHVSVKHVMLKIPELQDFFDLYGLPRPYSMAFIYAENMQGGVHIDLVKDIRLLWPVANCTGSRTRWFHIEPEFIKLIHDPMINNAPFYHIDKPEPYEQIAELELTQPAVFNSGIPHGIYCNEDAGPRLSFTVRFAKSIEHMLS